MRTYLLIHWRLYLQIRFLLRTYLLIHWQMYLYLLILTCTQYLIPFHFVYMLLVGIEIDLFDSYRNLCNRLLQHHRY